jgi:competence protein ComEC
METIPPAARPVVKFQSARYPAIAILILLAAGIALRDFAPIRPGIWLAACAVMLIAAAIFRKNVAADAILAISIFLTGLSAAQIDRFQFPANHIWIYTDDANRFAQLELRLSESPRLFQTSTGLAHGSSPKQSVRAQAIGVQTESGWKSARGNLLLEIEQFNPQIAAGQILRVSGILSRPQPPSNPGEFDFAEWGRQQRLLAVMRVSHSDGVQIVSEAFPSPLNWLREKTRHLLAMGFTLDRAGDFALLRAFVLGDSDPSLSDLEQKFVATGTVHCLSISGLHVAIVGAMALVIARFLRFSPRKAIWIALGAVLLYGAVALPTWPGWRSIIMAAAAGIGLLNRRWPAALQTFSAAVAVILLIHPADLINEGFQISFMAVLGMILLAGPVTRELILWWRGPDAAGLTPRRRSIIGSIWAAIVLDAVTIALAGLVAWIFLMPLLAYHFGQINIWSVPAGVALLPLTILALQMGIAKIFLTLCWPTAAHFWAGFCTIPVLWMRQIIEFLDKLPGASIIVPSPPIGFLIVYYALLAAALIPKTSPLWRKIRFLAPATACAGILLWPLAARPALSPLDREFHITLLSLGAGQCAILRGPGNEAVFIDAGSSSVPDLYRAEIAPCLRSAGCSSVREIILSHGDYDHISAAADIFDNDSQPPVLISPHFIRHAMGNEPAEELLETLDAAGKPPKIIQEGDHLDLADGATIDVLWPPADCDMNSNNCGLVLMLHADGRNILFPADIQEPPERELLKNPGQLKCDVLIAPHHGSAESTTAEFLRAADPKYILASSDRRLTHKQKVFDLLAKSYPFYRTGNIGMIDVTIDADGKIAISTFTRATAVSGNH